MTDFSLVASQAVQKWSVDYAQEYIRENPLKPYMGPSADSIIRVRNELLGSAGSAVHFPLIARLRGAGVADGTTLYGSEDTLPDYSDCVRTKLVRNAVMITEDQSYKTELDLFNAARSSLKWWSASKLRDDLYDQFQSIIVKGANETDGTTGEDTSVLYASASEAQKDAYLDLNYDRILFGAVKSNISTSAPAGGATRDFSASLLNVDNTADKLSASILRTAKTMAKKAGSLAGKPHIMPVKADGSGGQENYVLLCSSEGFRDLSADAEIIQANLYARAREGGAEGKNPIFVDGDLLYRGIVIRECPELNNITGVGAGGIDVGFAFLCGQNAINLTWAAMPTPRVQQFDYGHRNGVAIREIRGQKKTSFNGVQYGCVTIAHAAVGDT